MSQPQITKSEKSHTFLMKMVLGSIVLVFIIVIGLNIAKGIGISKYLANLGEPINPVTALKAESQSWTPVIETTGLVRPNQGAMLSAQAAGTVSKIFVHSGQKVKKGDLLVELDSNVEKATLQASEAQLDSVQKNYLRSVSLFKTSSVSQQELDNAKANFDQLSANIEALKASLARRQIYAPFDGVIGIIRVNEGQYANVGTEIVRIEDASSMKVDFSISQNELEKLFIGQKVTATADARLGETFAAKITAIEPAVNSATGLIDVQATFDDADSKKLLSGMFVRLRVALTTETNQIIVPQVAISYNMYGEMAYVLQPLSDEDKQKLADKPNLDKIYRAKQITVSTKDRQGVYAQLQGNDVKIGDLIVTSGQQRLSNGSLVSLEDKQAVGTTQPAKKTNL